MAYHKRPATERACAHCGTVFPAAHKARLYCSASCNTLAWRARRAAAAPKGTPASPTALAAPPLPVATSPQGLDFTLRNVGVIAVGTAVGQLAVQAGTHLVQALARPTNDAWVPVELRQATGSLRWVQLPGWAAPQQAVQGVYRGYVFYYCAAARLLFGETTTGALLPIPSRAQLDRLLPPERVLSLLPVADGLAPSTPPALAVPDTTE